jgi:hypothetical protein
MARSTDLFTGVRNEILERAVEARAGLKLGLGAQPRDLARAQLEPIIDRMGQLLERNDLDRLRAFVERWVAFHLGEGFAPEDMAHSIAALSDLMCGTARDRLPAGADAAGLVRDLTRITLVFVRMVVDVLAGELERVDFPERETRAR